ncbi:MAG TPA: restriction endonuclease subunit S [Bacteroidales bacterium]|nr:restriction endonuclease subunit S [Bacteroidales bacterium]
MSWKKVKLGEFLIVRDDRFKPNDKAIAELKRIDKIDFSGEIYISDKPSNTDMILIKKGDLVISGINVEKGAMAVYTGDNDITATIHYSSYSFDETKIDIDFLKYFLKSIKFKNALKEQVPGGIKTEIKPKHLLPLIVNIPTDIKDQKALVKVLQNRNSKVDAISTELTHQLSLVKKLRQQLLQDAVQGKLVPQNPNDEPASELLNRIKAEKAKSGKKEKPLPPIKPEEIPFEIPESWVWCRLGDLCSKIGSGSTPKGSNYSKSGFPFFRSQNIYNEGLVYDDIKFVSDEVQKQMNGTIVLSNDILLNITGGSMGRCALVPDDFEKGNVSQHVCIIRPIAVDRNFFHKIVLSPYFQKFVFSSTTGAGREGLPKYNLERFVIPIPPLSEQKRIVHEIEKQLAKTKQLKEHIIANQQATEQLLKALLHGAFLPAEEAAPAGEVEKMENIEFK